MALMTDQKSFFALTNGTKFVPFPLLRGSRFMDDPNVVKEFLAANSAFEAVNWVTGLSQPAVFVRTRVFGGFSDDPAYANWFSKALTANFAIPNMGTNSLIELILGLPKTRDATTGLIQSLGPCVYAHAGSPVRHYTECKLASVTLRMSGPGAPIDASLLFMPYGTEVIGTGLAVAPSGGAWDAAVLATYGMPFHGAGASYGSSPTMNEVWDWTLTFNNGLMPSQSTPDTTTDTATGRVLVKSYTNGPFNYSFQATMGVGASARPGSDRSVKAGIPATLVLADPAGANPITMGLELNASAIEETYNQQASLLSVSYTNIKTDMATDSLAIT